MPTTSDDAAARMTTTTATAKRPRRVGGSLASRLARTLILSVGGVWLACVLGVVWYVDREINFNFDNELVEVSHRMFDIAAEQYDQLSQGHVPAQPLVAPSVATRAAASARVNRCRRMMSSWARDGRRSDRGRPLTGP